VTAPETKEIGLNALSIIGSCTGTIKGLLAK
jgi:hypothetical protein